MRYRPHHRAVRLASTRLGRWLGLLLTCSTTLSACAGPSAQGRDTGAVEEPRASRWPELLPARGPHEAPVTIVVFSDLQCPFCGRLTPTLDRLRATYPNQVRIVFANLPLSFHALAEPAARAALAAHRQGRFWELHDRIFANQRALGQAWLDAQAADLGLDLAAYERDRNDPAISDEIQRQQQIANAIGVVGTPCSFVNGEKVSGAVPYDHFAAAVQRALDRMDSLRSRGQRGAALTVAAWRAGGGEVGERLFKLLIQGEPLPLRDTLLSKPLDPAALPWMGGDVWNVPVDPARDEVWGSNDAAEVTWVVFSDLQCPFCRRLHATARQLRDAYGDRLRVVWKDQPLPFHKLARSAALAAHAAGRQGQFWPFVDACMAGADLDDAGLERVARKLGLDLGRWQADRQDALLARRVDEDMALAKSLGVRGTPTSFIDGRKLVGAQPVAKIQEAIERALRDGGGASGQAAYAARVAAGRAAAISARSHGPMPGLGLHVPLGRPQHPRHDLFVIADLDAPEGRIAVHNALYAAHHRGSAATLRVLPIVGPTERSRVLARAAFWLARTRPDALLDVLALAVLRPRADLQELLDAALAPTPDVDARQIDTDAPSLDQELARQFGAVAGLGLAGLPAILVDGVEFSHERGHVGAMLLSRLR